MLARSPSFADSSMFGDLRSIALVYFMENTLLKWKQDSSAGARSSCGLLISLEVGVADGADGAQGTLGYRTRLRIKTFRLP